MAPLRALPGVAKVYFHDFLFSCFREMFFLEIQSFCKKVEISQKSNQNHQSRHFDLVTGDNWYFGANFHEFHEFW